MTQRIARHDATRISAAEAARLVRPGMWLDFGVSVSQPDVFDSALAARVAELHDVKVRSCIALKPRAFVEADPRREHFESFSWHFGGYDRAKHDVGLCHYIPLNLGEVPDYYRRFIDPVDILVIKTRPIDADGWFNFGPTNVWNRAVIERARMVIVEESEGFPHVLPQENGVHVGEVDYIIEGDGAPTPEYPNPPPTEIDRTIARLIAGEVDNGCCLQIGIGALPNAVCSLLRESGVRDIGVHTEMLTEGIIEPVDHTNLPHIIMKNHNVVSINSTTQIDLQGQAASESDGHRHISGTGGQLQFVRGAYASKGGKSFICLPSTYERRGVRKSRIVLDLTPGNIVTTPRSDVMYVVTEYGMVNLKGRSVCERARALIDLAHPDFREELERAAHEHGLLPRSVAARSLA